MHWNVVNPGQSISTCFNTVQHSAILPLTGYNLGSSSLPLIFKDFKCNSTY